MNVIHFTQRLVDKFEFSEIDFDLHDFIGFDYEKHDDWARIGDSDINHPIEIDRLITKLNEFKQQGANFVEIDYHCDHIGYILQGFKIQKSTKEEIAEHLIKKEAKKTANKHKRKQELLNELKRLEDPG